MKEKEPVEIIPFSDKYTNDLKRLNYEWLEKYFYVEKTDVKVLSNPKKYILDKGGFIFYAKIGQEIVGSAALMPEDLGVYELGKMAVSQDYQGRGIGNILLRHCIEFAKKIQAKKLFLITDSKLQPALHLYEKFGFKEVPYSNTVYERGDIQMELPISKN